MTRANLFPHEGFTRRRALHVRLSCFSLGRCCCEWCKLTWSSVLRLIATLKRADRQLFYTPYLDCCDPIWKHTVVVVWYVSIGPLDGLHTMQKLTNQHYNLYAKALSGDTYSAKQRSMFRTDYGMNPLWPGGSTLCLWRDSSVFWLPISFQLVSCSLS
jgi:hypothetical protein